MTCYFRHLKRVFEKTGITITKENKQDIDRVIHSIVGVDYKNCSATWKEVKKRIAEDEESFVNMLKRELAEN
jgi:ATP-dependent Zn protease